MNKKGFTLIELLVVVAISGLLSTVAVVALSSARLRARDSKRLSDLKQVQSALELYYTDNNAYPTAATAVTLGSGAYQCLNSTGWAAAGCANPYMGQVARDPGTGTYLYTSANGTSYSISATLEGTVNNLTGTIYATQSGISVTST